MNSNPSKTIQCFIEILKNQKYVFKTVDLSKLKMQIIESKESVQSISDKISGWMRENHSPVVQDAMACQDYEFRRSRSYKETVDAILLEELYRELAMY